MRLTPMPETEQPESRPAAPAAPHTLPHAVDESGPGARDALETALTYFAAGTGSKVLSLDPIFVSSDLYVSSYLWYSIFV